MDKLKNQESFNNNMYENIIIVPRFHSYGDTFSLIGMIYFLLKYYKKIYLYVSPNISSYFTSFFSGCNYSNERIFVIHDEGIIDKINNSNFGDYHICNLYEPDPDLFKQIENIDKKYYFNSHNPFYNELSIDEKYKQFPNLPYPFAPGTMVLNHVCDYYMMGLNNYVRMDFFNYSRDTEKEIFYKNEILKKYNLNSDDKYNIIHSAGSNYDINTINKYNNNNFITIDIHNLIEFPGWLFLLIEDAECVNLVEGSTCNFIYHSDYKNIIKIKNPIFFHVWLRNRSWPPFGDAAWKMMITPMLSNWQFIYEDV